MSLYFFVLVSSDVLSVVTKSCNCYSLRGGVKKRGERGRIGGKWESRAGARGEESLPDSPQGFVVTVHNFLQIAESSDCCQIMFYRGRKMVLEITIMKNNKEGWLKGGSTVNRYRKIKIESRDSWFLDRPTFEAEGIQNS